MTARLHYWYLTHPRWGRPALLLAVLHALSIIAVCTAPQATASTNAMVLNWTGLVDTHGVPIGNYYLAIPSVREQITEAGPGVDWNPASWQNWLTHALQAMVVNLAAAQILTAEAGLFVGVVALALWLMKLTVSTYWLAVIGEIARAVSSAVIQVTTQLGLLALAVPIGVFCGVVTVKRGEAGRGWTMILIALTMPALSIAVFADPARAMYGPDGVLAFARRVGFSTAQAATHNGSFPGTGGGGQVDALTASLITHTVREPLQLWNFGQVVDRVGGCGPAWSAAVDRGAPDGPIRAMQACGNRAAATYAQHLDGSNIWVGAVFVVAALLLGLLMVAAGWAVLKVSVKAIWTTVILLPSLWLGSIPGAPQRRAMDVVWQFFRHGIEVFVYIVFVSVIGLTVESMVSRPLPAELGGANPFARVLMMGAVSVAAVMLLGHIRADLSGRSRGPGLFRRAGHVALGMGMHAAVGAAGAAGLKGARGVGRRLGSGGGRPPWEQLDDHAGDARAVHGAPQPGFDPVPDPGDGRGSGGGGGGGTPQPGPGGGASGGGGGGFGGADIGSGSGASVPAAAPAAAPISDQTVGASGRGQGSRRARPGRAHAGAVPHAGLDHRAEPDPVGDAAPDPPAAEAPTAPPITDLPDVGDPGPVPPPEPPPDDEPPEDDDTPCAPA